MAIPLTVTSHAAMARIVALTPTPTQSIGRSVVAVAVIGLLTGAVVFFRRQQMVSEQSTS
ncbi:hypothetical protein H2248_003515 [Termitomyces sp. 'cryptogamus']|nr:hypothetical protein H2248_003515 [Termitomyces sp. 'cryptogamus']